MVVTVVKVQYFTQPGAFIVDVAFLFLFLSPEHHKPSGWDLPAPPGDPCSRHHDANTDHTTHRYLRHLNKAAVDVV